MPAKRTMEAARLLFAGAEGACWRLPQGVGAPHGNGYYRLSVSGTQWFAHRLAYTLFVGPIPDGLTIDHVCHNTDPGCLGGDSCPHRACCNPAHLEAVPIGTNALRGKSAPAENARREVCDNGHPLVQKGRGRRFCPVCRLAGRIAKGETSGNGHFRDRERCTQGHLYDEENTYVHRKPDGSPCCRMCRACIRARRRASRSVPRKVCPACKGEVGFSKGGSLRRHYAVGTRTWCTGVQ